MKKCDCYHTQPKTRYTYNPITGQPIAHDIEVGVCWGTKETDECSCNGDRTKCDFYPEVRKKARKEFECKKPITRADNIRSMSDEQLAKLLAQGIYNDKKIDIDEICHKGMCLDDETCDGCMLKWLQKPTEDQ